MGGVIRNGGKNEKYLLYIGVGIPLREDIRVLLPEDMPHTTAGDYFQASSAHPDPE